MSTCVLKALSGKLDIKRHSPSILYISAPTLHHPFMMAMTTVPVNASLFVARAVSMRLCMMVCLVLV